MAEKLFEIGHIAEDIATPTNVIGGGVSYSGIVAKELGFDVSILTKLPPSHPYIDAFQQRGIRVLTAPTNSLEITTFNNTYDENGRRKQLLLARQETITSADLASVDSNLLHDSIFLIAPVIGEVETGVIPLLAQKGMVAVTPQGYFRDVDQNGVVFQREWTDFEKDLSHATVTILSDEDISINGVLNEGLLGRIRDCSEIVVLTQGEKGSTIYKKGDEPLHVSAFALQQEELRDFTGAGDTYAATFIAIYSKTHDIKLAALTAGAFASMKIMALEGNGIYSIATYGTREEFMAEHKDRFNEYLEKNDASGTVLFPVNH